MFVRAGVYGRDQDHMAAATMHEYTSLGAYKLAKSVLLGLFGGYIVAINLHSCRAYPLCIRK